MMIAVYTEYRVDAVHGYMYAYIFIYTYVHMDEVDTVDQRKVRKPQGYIPQIYTYINHRDIIITMQ